MRCSKCKHYNPVTGTSDGRCDKCGFPLAANIDSANLSSNSIPEQRFRAQPWNWRMGQSQVEVVTIVTFSNAIEASLAKQELEAEGLTAFLEDDFITGLLWHLSVAVGWIKLRVPGPQVEQAISILLDSRAYQQAMNNDDHPRISWADQTVERMFRVAVLSLIFLPLQFYSLWLLIRLLVSGRRVTPHYYWKIPATLAVNTPTITIAIVLFTFFVK